MTETLIHLDTAKLAKEKGLDINTKAFHVRLNEPTYMLPTQALLQKWLREQFLILVSVKKETIGSDEWEWSYVVEWLPNEHQQAKRRCGFFETKESFSEGFGTYTGAWHTYEQAMEEGLKFGLGLITQ